MNDIVDMVRKALSEDLAATGGEDLVEWNDETPGVALSALSHSQGLPIKGWGMRIDEQSLAQALIPTGIGNVVIDLEQDPFFETQHRSIRIDSETDRAIAQSDAEYALELMWPDEAPDAMRLLAKMGMEIVPAISDYGNAGNLTYSRNEMRPL